MELTIQPVRRLFKHVGAKRISDAAAEELAKLIEKRAKDIIQKADELSKHSSRRTIMKNDIKMAYKILDK